MNHGRRQYFIIGSHPRVFSFLRAWTQKTNQQADTVFKVEASDDVLLLGITIDKNYCQKIIVRKRSISSCIETYKSLTIGKVEILGNVFIDSLTTLCYYYGCFVGKLFVQN